MYILNYYISPNIVKIYIWIVVVFFLYFWYIREVTGVSSTLQLNKNNNSNGYLKKFWKPIISIEEGIEKIYYYYKAKNK